MDIETIKLLGQFGAAGILLIVYWHYTTKVWPRQQEYQRSILEEQRKDFLAALAQERADNQTFANDLGSNYEKSLERQIAHCLSFQMRVTQNELPK